MALGRLLADARRRAGLSQDELAERAGTSRPTLSAYERDRRSPTLRTAARILAAAGFEFDLAPRVVFTEHGSGGGRVIVVPSALWRLEPEHALAVVRLPLHLDWSAPGRVFDMSDRRQRARVYEVVLREGGPEDLSAYIDGVLLVELWNELVLPRAVRAVWAPLIERAAPVAA